MGIKGMNASYEKRLRHHVEISVVDANASTLDFCEWRLTNIPHAFNHVFKGKILFKDAKDPSAMKIGRLKEKKT
jgi:hypothetical protein